MYKELRKSVRCQCVYLLFLEISVAPEVWSAGGVHVLLIKRLLGLDARLAPVMSDHGTHSASVFGDYL